LAPLYKKETTMKNQRKIKQQAPKTGEWIDATAAARWVGFVVPVALSKAADAQCLAFSAPPSQPPAGLGELLWALRGAVGTGDPARRIVRFDFHAPTEDLFLRRRYRLIADFRKDKEGLPRIAIKLASERHSNSGRVASASAARNGRAKQ
jgi:hypothetical protein